MNRTVRCRWCYKSGHNKLSCPQMKEDAAKNPNGYAASTLARIAESKKQGRRCSYCSECGHNRTTCKKIFEDGVKIINVNKKYRQKLLDFMKDKSIGVGALVKIHNTRGYNTKGEWLSFENQLALITEVSVNDANCLVSDSSFIRAEFLSVKEYDGSPQKTTLLFSNKDVVAPPVDNILNKDNYYTWELVSPGHVMLDDEQKFLNCENIVESTKDHLPRHSDVTHALMRCKFNN